MAALFPPGASWPWTGKNSAPSYQAAFFRDVRLLSIFLLFATVLALLLTAGCGGSGGGSPQGQVIVQASADPVIGTPAEEGTRKQWQWTALFREAGGAAVTFTGYDRVINGTNGYSEESRDNPFPFVVDAGSTASYDFTLLSARTPEGTPSYVAGTSNYAFHGRDSGGHDVTANLTVDLQ